MTAQVLIAFDEVEMGGNIGEFGIDQTGESIIISIEKYRPFGVRRWVVGTVVDGRTRIVPAVGAQLVDAADDDIKIVGLQKIPNMLLVIWIVIDFYSLEKTEIGCLTEALDLRSAVADIGDVHRVPCLLVFLGM